MKVSIATIGAVTLGSHVMAQGPVKPIKDAAKTIDRIEIPEAFNQLGEWKLDACHKVDSAVGGLIWPCASKMRTEMALCPTMPNTAEERKAQRDCLCGEGSSLLQDAAACVQCKRENGLQADSHKQHWSDYYKEVDEKYCKVLDAPVSYEAFIEALNQRMPEPPAGNNLNRLIGVVADPKSYYETAGVGVPKKQGGGKFTPATPKAENGKKNSTAPVAPVVPVVDQVKVPVFVAVADLPAASEDETSTSSISSAPFKNATASIRPTASSLDIKPSTFLTVTTSSSAATGTTSLLPATTLAPTPGIVNSPVEEHIIVIDGKPCLVYVIWVIIDCVPRFDARGNFAIGFENKGIDEREAPRMVENKEQFDKVKDVICDGGKDVKLVEQAKQHVGTEAPVVQAPSGSNKQQLPPVKQTAGESKVPSTSNQPASGSKPVNSPANSGSQPANDDEEACPAGYEPAETIPNTGIQADVPATNGNKPATSAPAKNPSTQATVPVANGDKPATSAPATNPSTQATVPVANGEKPATGSQTSGNPSSGLKTLADNQVCECPPVSECPPASAATVSADAKEICAKKEATETACRKLSGNDVHDCLCSEGKFAEQTFFDEAVICSRRSGEPHFGEFNAQIFFEVKYRFCQLKKNADNFEAAFNEVVNEWSEARAPIARLM